MVRSNPKAIGRKTVKLSGLKMSLVPLSVKLLNGNRCNCGVPYIKRTLSIVAAPPH